MVINDFYYDFFDSSGLNRDPLDEFLFNLLYAVAEDYDVLKSNVGNIKSYLNSLKVNHNSLWFEFNYGQFSKKDFRILVNFGLRKIRINDLEIRPGFFKDPLDYFYLVKLCFTVKNAVEIISENYNDVYTIRILDRVHVKDFTNQYFCSLVGEKVKIVTKIHFNVFDVPKLLEAFPPSGFIPSEEFYKNVFDDLVGDMKLVNYKTYLNGLCFTLLYNECKELYPNFNFSKYEEFILRALEVKNLLCR